MEENPADSGNPFMSPAPPSAPAPVGPPVVPFSRLGDILGRAFNAYGSQWSAWPVPVLVCGVIALGSYLACVLPYFLAQGPLMCGLYWCAFLNLRGWPVSAGSLERGWYLFWPATSSAIMLVLVEAIPGFLLSAVMLAAFLFSGALVLPKPGAAPNPAEMFPLMFSMMAVWMPLTFLMMIWTFWISTRTMFVMPLVADRGYDFFAAWRASWEATRHRFWERLLLVFLARIMATLGVYLCYVGLLFTFSIQFLIIAAAYEDEFGIEGVPAPAVPPGGTGGSPIQTGAGATESPLAR